MDTRYDYRSFFWPVVLIGIGLFWLLGNLGLLSSVNLAFLFRLWPLLLIFIGLDLIFARRSAILGGLLGLAMVLIVAVLVFAAPRLGLTQSAGLKTETFIEPLDGATRANIELDLWSTPMRVEALSNSENLFEAEITHVGEVIFETRGSSERTIRLSHERFIAGPWGFFAGLGEERGRIGLSPETPIDLEVNVGSGSVELNLAELQLTSLDVEGGSGSLDVSLPETGQRLAARMNTGSGSVDLLIPGGAQLDLNLESGSGSIDIEIAEEASLTLELDTGSGSVRVDVPDGAAIRVEVEDDGSGALNIGGGLEQVSGDDDSGVWETPGFDEAENQILIVVSERGSGSVTIR